MKKFHGIWSSCSCRQETDVIDAADISVIAISQIDKFASSSRDATAKHSGPNGTEEAVAKLALLFTTTREPASDIKEALGLTTHRDADKCVQEDLDGKCLYGFVALGGGFSNDSSAEGSLRATEKNIKLVSNPEFTLGLPIDGDFAIRVKFDSPLREVSDFTASLLDGYIPKNGFRHLHWFDVCGCCHELQNPPASRD